ncbi:MAG: hypothetical protein BWY99_00715 [Synergistetes bacterium ADurb.BinA166]|nr:MAG: hypothetical protein BWY99_00715 [Synergistetes bacterium ADurb.BinA166]
MITSEPSSLRLMSPQWGAPVSSADQYQEVVWFFRSIRSEGERESPLMKVNGASGLARSNPIM